LILDDALHYLQARGMAGNHYCKIEYTATFTVDNGSLNGLGQSHLTAQGNQTSVESQDFPYHGMPDLNRLAYANGSAHTHQKSKLLVWTAADEKAINRLTEAYKPFYRDTVSSTPERTNRLAYTLSNRRGRMLWRSFAITQEGKTISPVTPVRSSTVRGLAFIFTGQGAQYTKMGVELLRYPIFARQMVHIDAIYKSLGSGWSVFGMDTIISVL
jgi:acyl transferase domain-containing protein